MEPLIYETILIGLLRRTGDDALKIEFHLQFFCLSKYVVFYRIRGPPSFNLKEILD